MPTDSIDPLEEHDLEAVTADDVDMAEVRAALDASRPLVRQRGVEACETLASDDIDAVVPLLDDLPPLPDDEYAPVALRVSSVLNAVADADPTALDGRLDGLVSALDNDIVDVQLTAATVLAKLVVDHPDIVAPHAPALVAALRETEPDEEAAEYGEFIDDPVTRQTLMEHDQTERERLVAARTMLADVVVALAETAPESAFDAVDDLRELLDDVDSGVVGRAVAALGHIATVDAAVVAPASDRLRDCLTHPDHSVRARAVQAIGRLGDDAAVPQLRTVADEDENEAVREIAAETADFLAAE